MEEDSSFSAMAPLVFNGDNYTIWAVRMEAYLDVVDLWEAVEDDYDERKTKKSKAKACLFAAVSATIFTRIMSLKSSKAIWSYLKFEYEGDDQIKGMKVLNLIRDFELQKMKESETIKEFEATITTLENTKDLSKITLAELLNSLQAQEQQMVMRQEATVEEALPAKHEDGWRNKKKKNRKHQQANGEAAAHRSNKNKAGSSKGKYPPCKHCDRTGHSPFKCWKRPDAKCNKCNQLGHEAIICKNQNQQQDADAQIANEDENDHLFVATCFSGSISSDSWLIDKIGHGGHIPAKGIGTVAIATHLGTKVIDDVLYVPK
ncbi:hypothetical protein AAG906_004323 [Vitis piasezkii]